MKKTMYKPLNTLRKFDAGSKIKEYFKFPNVDKDGNQSTYQMNDKQMTEWEDAQVRRTVNQVVHQMRRTYKTVERVTKNTFK